MPMTEVFEIGGSPHEESCAAIGEHFPDGADLNRLECRAYIAALRAHYGPEPEGARLTIRENAHEFGIYREVVCRFFSDDPQAYAYAGRVEAGLARWHDAGFWPPVTYDEKNQAVYIIRDPSLWPKADNPHCFKDKPANPDG